jgi:hypothetical protein
MAAAVARAAALGLDPRVPALHARLSFPGGAKLFLAAKSQGVPLTYNQARAFVEKEEANQTFAPRPRYGGKVTASGPNERWAADLVDMKASPAVTGEKAILVVQDIFTRKVTATALMGKTAAEVARAFPPGRPAELTTDGGLEFTGAFARLMVERGIAHRVKPTGRAHVNETATIDAAIRSLREDLGRVKAGNNWPAFLDAVVNGLNAKPNPSVLDQPPDSVETNPTLQFALKAKNGQDMAKSAAFAQKHDAALERAGAGRELLAIGPFPRQRAGAAKWGEKRALTVSNGMATTATGRVPSKALRPA